MTETAGMMQKGRKIHRNINEGVRKKEGRKKEKINDGVKITCKYIFPPGCPRIFSPFLLPWEAGAGPPRRRRRGRFAYTLSSLACGSTSDICYIVF